VKETTIKLSRETKKRLDDLGKKGMTYEEVILTFLPKEEKNV
jgi:predicted DNA-binding protein